MSCACEHDCERVCAHCGLAVHVLDTCELEHGPHAGDVVCVACAEGAEQRIEDEQRERWLMSGLPAEG